MADADPTHSASLIEAAATLYALPLEEFTAERNQLAKGTPDKALAGQIRKLPKPSTAGWLVNMLVRQRHEAVDRALGLGVDLRDAQEQLDRNLMNELGQQRQRLLNDLGKEGVVLARDRGQTVSASVAAEVEQTFRAAMTDPDAATAVSTGRLLRSLSASGWDAVDLDGAVGGPFEPSVGGSASNEESSTDEDQRIEAARAALKEAERMLGETDEDAADAGRRLERFQDRRTGITAEIDELQRRMSELRGDLRTLDNQLDDAEREHSSTVRAAREARRAVDNARHQLDKLL